MSKKHHEEVEAPVTETPAVSNTAEDKILTVSEYAKLSAADQEDFRRGNGTVTPDPI